jgi:hypothetical protein
MCRPLTVAAAGSVKIPIARNCSVWRQRGCCLTCGKLSLLASQTGTLDPAMTLDDGIIYLCLVSSAAQVQSGFFNGAEIKGKHCSDQADMFQRAHNANAARRGSSIPYAPESRRARRKGFTIDVAGLFDCVRA